MKNYLNYFAGKTVYITGHTGFKGAWLSYLLQTCGAKVVGYALPPNTSPSLFESLGLDSLVTSHIGDIRDISRLRSTVTSANPDFIFHLAAQPLVRTSYVNPLETYETNVIGTANLLEVIRSLEKQVTSVFVTTDKVYRNHEWQYPYREIDQLGGKDPYSASKAASELVLESYFNCFFRITPGSHEKKFGVARAGNVIGGGDWSADRLIPDFVRATLQGKPIIIRYPAAIRPWQHVLESLNGYLVLAHALDLNLVQNFEPWNFGPTTADNVSVSNILGKAIQCWGKGEVQVEGMVESSLMPEAGLLKLDISKATTLLNWHPRWSVDEAVKQTIQFYKNFKKSDVTFNRSLLNEQIEFFYEGTY